MLTSRVTREKQRSCKSATYDYSSRNKIKVMQINTLGNAQIKSDFLTLIF